MDQDLIAYLDERFRETSRQIESLREETTQRFERLEERTEEGFRHTGMEIEALRGEVRQVAEGVMGANESLESFREAVAVEFKEVRASIRAPFENLDGRVRILETHVLGKNPRKAKSRPPS
jgi:DNA repair exonuclease SbcCD ATPase subunit